MLNRIRQQLDRAARVATFIREHRADLEAFTGPITGFETRLARATQVAKDLTTTRLATSAAVAERNDLGATLMADLRLLDQLAQVARTDSVVIPIVIQFPTPRSNQVQFLSGARGMVETARQHAEALASYGMKPDLPEQLTVQLDRYEALISGRSAAAQAQVATTREMTQADTELGVAIFQLSSLFTRHFRKDPVTLRAWSSAVGIRSRHRKEEVVPTEAPAQLALPAATPSTAADRSAA